MGRGCGPMINLDRGVRVVTHVYNLRCVLWLPLITVDVLNLLCCVCGCGPFGKTKLFWCTYCAPFCGVAYHHVGIFYGCLVFTVFCVVPLVFSRIYFVPVVGVCGFVAVSDDVGVSSGCLL